MLLWQEVAQDVLCGGFPTISSVLESTHICVRVRIDVYPCTAEALVQTNISLKYLKYIYNLKINQLKSSGKNKALDSFIGL